MPDENEKNNLSDSLVGVLKIDYDYKEERAEHMKKYESDDWNTKNFVKGLEICQNHGII